MQELEIAETVIQEAQKVDAIDDCDVRSAPSVELCSTSEMLEVFSEFYDGDKQDMHGYYVDNTRIDSSVPFSAKEFDLDFRGSAEQVELPNMDFGVSTDAYDLNELLRGVSACQSLANAKQVAEFEAHLHIDVWKDAKQVMTRIAGRPLSGKVTIEMTMLQVNGLQELDTGSELVKKTPSDTLGRSVFEHGIVVRRAIWSCKSSMGKVYPTLSPVARCLLSLHATSAAPERNWSYWGRLYRKDRSSLALTRA
ncbi:TPA: hypothetical protein ACH3X1_014619 [Trebouxia sp. C0004]